MATARKTPLRAVKSAAPDYVLRIELLDVKPVIWRRLMLPGSIKLDMLHQVLRCTMGWEGGHLYDLDFRDQHYGPPFDDSMSGMSIDEGSRVKLVTALGGAKSFRYLYDISAGWDHKIKVEKVLPADPTSKKVALCIDGERACPPENSYPEDYMDFLQAIADPAHGARAEMLKRYGGEFDPAAFSTTTVNETLWNIKI